MRKAPAEVTELAAPLDGSHASAAAHLRGIHTPERRVDAAHTIARRRSRNT